MQKTLTWSVRDRTDEYVRRVAAADVAAFAFRLPRKLYRVSEVADCLGISRQTIHNYATAGLIAEEGHTPGGQRLFSESVFQDILLIHRLKATHRLQEIRRILIGRRRHGGTVGQAVREVPAMGAAARQRERAKELLGLAHRDATMDTGGQATSGTPEGSSSTIQNPPAGAMTSVGPEAVPQAADRQDVGPDFAVRAPSDQPPSAGESPSATDRPTEAGPADLRHVKETPKDEQQRG